MNWSFTNVLFGAFRCISPRRRGEDGQERHADVADISPTPTVVIIPLRMAVAQPSTSPRAYDQLTKRGVDVKFAIHPVAGRMPGHMNVRLAEVRFLRGAGRDGRHQSGEPQTDVCLVVGANDVVNRGAQ